MTTSWISEHKKGIAMLNFGRRDRFAEGKSIDKTTLKPALYDPPGSAGRLTTNPTPRAAPPHGASESHEARAMEPPVLPMDAALKSVPVPSRADIPVSKLAVGINIKLRGVDISDCDVLVIEGHVEATVHSKAMEIASPGTLKGTALIDVAEIHGEFSGELTARTRLVVHGTGRVSGTIRYGKLIVAEGGELNGDVKRLDEAEDSASATRHAGSGAPVGLPPVSGFTPH
jgi:cytoskeletal protein CcmA (bactofilin family)